MTGDIVATARRLLNDAKDMKDENQQLKKRIRQLKEENVELKRKLRKLKKEKAAKKKKPKSRPLDSDSEESESSTPLDY